MIRFWPTLILFLLISVFRFYTFCLPVRCCRAFVAAGPTTSGMKWTTMGEWQDLYSRRRTPDVGIYTQPLPCYLTSNQFFVSTKHSDFIPDRLYRKVFWGSKTDATLVYLSFYQVLDACTTFFWGGRPGYFTGKTGTLAEASEERRFAFCAPSPGVTFNCFKRKLKSSFFTLVMRPRCLVIVILGAMEIALCVCMYVCMYVWRREQGELSCSEVRGLSGKFS